jgi:ABC-2 type transport system ATP-binding protein
MSERPVAARGLVKRYGHVLAVDGVDLTVDPGDVYGFLGPNGAGKTTTLQSARTSASAPPPCCRWSSSR